MATRTNPIDPNNAPAPKGPAPVSPKTARRRAHVARRAVGKNAPAVETAIETEHPAAPPVPPSRAPVTLNLGAVVPAIAAQPEPGADYPGFGREPINQATGLKATKAERRVQALNLRMVGHDYRTIATELGVGVRTAYADVQEALAYLAKYERALALDVRALELARLDALSTFVWPMCENGDPEAIDAQLKIMARRARMLGLDEPAQVELVTTPPPKTVIFGGRYAPDGQLQLPAAPAIPAGGLPVIELVQVSASQEKTDGVAEPVDPPQAPAVDAAGPGAGDPRPPLPDV